MEDKIIKARPTGDGVAASPAHKVVKRDIYEASIEAREIVETARQEAKTIIEGAQGQRDAVYAEAREAGSKEGLAKWNEVVLGAFNARDKYLKTGEEELLRLAVKIAEKIVGEQLKLQPETILAIVAEALKSVRREKSLAIKVHPEHVSQIRSRIVKLQEMLGSARDIQVIPSDSVAPGGCIIESELGTIDAQLETQLRCLEEILLREAKK